jgi:glucose/mannose-6-phosphate isomerase
VLWGTSPLTGAVAYRFACQLNENAKAPAVWGVLPEANHNQVVAFDGPFAGAARGGDGRLLPRPRRRRGAGGAAALVLLRDRDEHPQVTRARDVSAELARERDVPVLQLQAEGQPDGAARVADRADRLRLDLPGAGAGDRPRRRWTPSPP